MPFVFLEIAQRVIPAPTPNSFLKGLSSTGGRSLGVEDLSEEVMSKSLDSGGLCPCIGRDCVVLI